MSLRLCFRAKKLGGSSLMVEMKKAIIDDTIETFTEKTEDLANILSGQQVNIYLDHCTEYGRARAA